VDIITKSALSAHQLIIPEQSDHNNNKNGRSTLQIASLILPLLQVNKHKKHLFMTKHLVLRSKLPQDGMIKFSNPILMKKLVDRLLAASCFKMIVRQV